MKIRKELGSAAVRDLVLQAEARARELPYEKLHEPWTSWRKLTPEDPASEQDDSLASSR
jgi:hypothetical protein